MHIEVMSIWNLILPTLVRTMQDAKMDTVRSSLDVQV